MTHVHSPARTLLRLHGADTPDFLNRLLTLIPGAEAEAALQPYGAEAETLCELARFVIARDT